MTSSGSDLRPSGSCPCKTSNKADNAFVHKIGSIVLLSRINVKTLLKPIPTIFIKKKIYFSYVYVRVHECNITSIQKKINKIIQ